MEYIALAVAFIYVIGGIQILLMPLGNLTMWLNKEVAALHSDHYAQVQL